MPEDRRKVCELTGAWCTAPCSLVLSFCVSVCLCACERLMLLILLARKENIFSQFIRVLDQFLSPPFSLSRSLSRARLPPTLPSLSLKQRGLGTSCLCYLWPHHRSKTGHTIKHAVQNPVARNGHKTSIVLVTQD